MDRGILSTGIPSKMAPRMELIKNAIRVFTFAQAISKTNIRIVQITTNRIMRFKFLFK